MQNHQGLRGSKSSATLPKIHLIKNYYAHFSRNTNSPYLHNISECMNLLNMTDFKIYAAYHLFHFSYWTGQGLRFKINSYVWQKGPHYHSRKYWQIHNLTSHSCNMPTDTAWLLTESKVWVNSVNLSTSLLKIHCSFCCTYTLRIIKHVIFSKICTSVHCDSKKLNSTINFSPLTNMLSLSKYALSCILIKD